MFPEAFISRLRADIGKERADALLETMQKPAPVTVRINPAKITDPQEELSLPILSSLSASRYGYLLSERPVFTNDPLFQAGCYYVQEASSMILEHYFAYGNRVTGLNVLDLCAAPGGKSTHLLSLLGDIPGAILVSNEVISSRVTVLADNIARWGASNAVITNSDPADFKKLEGFFDVVLIDAPCSGEGMFRKDERAVTEWSEDNVRLCAARQRRIIADAVGSLKNGGLLIYSTCTFNREENEENTEWISSEYDMELIKQEHCYPGAEYGEGLFMAALRKNGESRTSNTNMRGTAIKPYKGSVPFMKEGFIPVLKGNLIKVYPADCAERMAYVESKLKTVKSGTAAATVLTDRRGVTTLIPEPDLTFSEVLERSYYPEVELSYEQAARFMRCEAMAFPESPKGYLVLTYKGHPLGFVKNIGPRANNLWPSARRIRLAHIVEE